MTISRLAVIRVAGNPLPPALSSLLEQWNSPRVDLSQRRLRELPPELFLMTKVVELYVNDNELTMVPADISRLTSLRVLDMRANKFASTPTFLKAFFPSLSKLHL